MDADDSDPVGMLAVLGLQLSYASPQARKIMYAVSLLGAAAHVGIAVLTTVCRHLSQSPVIIQGDRFFA